MKKILLLGLLFIGLNSFAQGTTQKEYNYASKGYADDLAMGKDIIAGYRLEDALTPKQSKVNEAKGNKQIVRYTFLKKLVRNGDNKVAAFILVQKRADQDVPNYYALPNNSADGAIWNQAQEAYVKNMDLTKCENMGVIFSYNWNVLRLLSEALSN